MRIYTCDCVVVGTGAAGYNAACRLTRFGKNAVLKGIDFTKSATRKERNMMIGGHMGGDE